MDKKLMKFALSYIACMFLAFAVAAQNKESILGIWQNATGEARIQIFKKADKYFGKIVWLKEPNKDGKPKVDSKNPNPAIAQQPIMGLELLKNFASKGKDEWGDGTIYDPKSGKTYSCKITMEGSNKVYIRGYIGISLLGRTEMWTRAK